MILSNMKEYKKHLLLERVQSLLRMRISITRILRNRMIKAVEKQMKSVFLFMLTCYCFLMFK